MVALAGGIAWTIKKDYLPWRKAETSQYGHGPGKLGMAGAANKLFEEGGAAVRINYPETWTVQAVWGSKTWPVKTDVAIFAAPKSDVKVTLEEYTVKQSLVDYVDGMVKERTAEGWKQWGERQYISTDRADITVITWQVTGANGQVRMRQQALVEKGNKLVMAEADCALGDWRTYSGVFWEMWKSLVAI